MGSGTISFASTGSLIANLVLFAVMENVSEPDWWSHGSPYEATYATRPTGLKMIETWRPFMDDPGSGGQRRRSCPEPKANHAGGPLPYAPLPAGYDPFAPLEQPFHACLLVGGDGRILSAKLLGSSGDAGVDRRMLSLIATRWRAVSPEKGEAPTWQRVRLNAGPDEDEVRDAYSMF